MGLEIVGFPRSNFVRAVRMVAEEKGVAYELVAEMPHSDVVKGLNPTGKIPAMRHDGLELCESLAIARYIDDAFDGPKMIPENPKAAAPVNRFTAFAATEVDQLLMRNYVVEYAFHKDEDGNVVLPEPRSTKRSSASRKMFVYARISRRAGLLRYVLLQHGRLFRHADSKCHEYVRRR